MLELTALKPVFFAPFVSSVMPVEPEWIDRLEEAGMVFSGRHPEHPIMQVLELNDEPPAGWTEDDPVTHHPYFIGAQFHPELTSRPLSPQPMFMGLVAAAIRHRYESDADRWAEIIRQPIIRQWLRRPTTQASAV